MLASYEARKRDAEELLHKHQLHTGLYARLGKRLGIDASYVSRVVSGERISERVMKAIVHELRRIEAH